MTSLLFTSQTKSSKCFVDLVWINNVVSVPDFIVWSVSNISILEVLKYILKNINTWVYMFCVNTCMYVESNVYICMAIKCSVLVSYSCRCKDGKFWYISWFKLLNSKIHVLQSYIATNVVLECKWKLEKCANTNDKACKNTPKNDRHMSIANLHNQVNISLNGF